MKSLQKKIEETGLKKAYIAQQLGITSSTLSRILSGKQAYVSADLMKRLEELLDKKK
ncbi:helix-turn-helix domain-containing protein [Fibrisoma montanum]|uniref:Helix-turn-helix domain-containing protein n=1 Tax=Fibrisoma montanum TaxID=2305895 RepID=A0A418MI57_9BACT|nr:helix-turn-helix domain-containing protein [Fibrisoma montanum]RIV27043.1 helix-turn-helix domain-containing protein [Fibrisoma montanum]